ncbi:PREDICTED: uncharacterized protein LOC104815641 isoform X1 [Tarenaya hassleriana]|uniref:uncharacterized protein LOC104815641 isoform X1 n=1 Tax=Tarenaya hassleriana TaxID=28532 RepID=UPI00053C119F|nr:PREDICTED: uncharacterized protein LOC104815641 isoform X1 [Tarenaya hassleriana]
MAAFSAILSMGIGAIRPSYPSLSSCLQPLRHQTSLLRCPRLVSRNERSSLKGILQASPQSNYASADASEKSPEEQSEIIFMGTGTSEGIPRLSCLTNPLKTCPVCTKATEPGNKNRRLNTSILVRYVRPSGTSNILIDCGKFFYHSALRWFPLFGLVASHRLANMIQSQSYCSIDFLTVSQCSFLTLELYYDDTLFVVGTCTPVITCCVSVRLRTIDAVIITHSHADAIGGLDDLRDWTNNVQPLIPIYTAMRDFEVMKKTHYYLVDTSEIIPGAAVSELQFNIIHEEQPFIASDLKITPLPVWHGRGYRSLGFRFGNVCYISDVSDIPEETYPLLQDCELLIMDALRPDRSSSTHFGLPRALEEVRRIKPRRTLFTGMMHLMDHEKVNEELEKLAATEGIDVQLSYDGLRVPISL